MRITEIREVTVNLGAPIRNADIRFDDMTGSAVMVVSDRIRDGRPVCGYAVDSIGRYGHGGLLRERFIPRLMAASPEAYAAETGDTIDPMRAWTVMMRNEKPGGHGERPGAVGVLDAALWDLAAKLEDRPLWSLLAERFNGGHAPDRVPVYASGGHYQDRDDLGHLAAAIGTARDAGHRSFKIKIGGAPLDDDLRRIEAAIGAAGGDGSALAVDGNGTFDRDRALRYAEAFAPYGLAWFEEPVDPLDYGLMAELCTACDGAFATGENIFSAVDTRNLLRHGGMRPDRDVLQMDVSLSYGIPEYLRIVDLLESSGWSRRRLFPHAGQLLAFHVVAGLGLGGHEVAFDPSSPFGALAAGMRIEDGRTVPGDAPGVGFETAPPLLALLEPALDAGR